MYALAEGLKRNGCIGTGWGPKARVSRKRGSHGGEAVVRPSSPFVAACIVAILLIACYVSLICICAISVSRRHMLGR